MPGRWADARQPNRKELAATLVLVAAAGRVVGEGQRRARRTTRPRTSTCPSGPACCRCARSRGEPVPAPDLRGAPPSRRTSVSGPVRDSRSGYRALSLWHDTADDDWAPRPALPGDLDVDVAIVGAGYTGLWTAYYLARADPSAARSSCSSARSPASARAAATAAGARRCSPRRWPGWRRRYGEERAVAQHRAMQATVDEVGAGRGRRGHRLRLRQGRHRRRSRARRCSWSGPGPRWPRPGGGASARTTSRCSAPTRPRDRLAAAGVLGGDVHAALRGRSTPPGWCAGWPARSSGSGVTVHERTPVTAIEPGVVDDPDRPGPRRGRGPRHRGLHRRSCPGCAGHSHRSTP